MISAIHHVSILTQNVGRAVKFYSEILDLTPSDKRPDLGFDGAWFEIGTQQIHLIDDSTGTRHEKPAVRCGRDSHIAFQVDNLDQLIDRLTRAGIEYEKSRSGRAALFCRDPDGNALEFIQTTGG